MISFFYFVCNVNTCLAQTTNYDVTRTHPHALIQTQTKFIATVRLWRGQSQISGHRIDSESEKIER